MQSISLGLILLSALAGLSFGQEFNDCQERYERLFGDQQGIQQPENTYVALIKLREACKPGEKHESKRRAAEISDLVDSYEINDQHCDPDFLKRFMILFKDSTYNKSVRLYLERNKNQQLEFCKSNPALEAQLTAVLSAEQIQSVENLAKLIMSVQSRSEPTQIAKGILDYLRDEKGERLDSRSTKETLKDLYEKSIGGLCEAAVGDHSQALYLFQRKFSSDADLANASYFWNHVQHLCNWMLIRKDSVINDSYDLLAGDNPLARAGTRLMNRLIPK